MKELGVNIDHVATLRQARGNWEPDPVFAAFICESNGADSIVVHLREDRRHIQDRDVFVLRKTVKTKLNLEMSVESGIVRIACEVKPDQATFVPEKRRELTTEGGLDVVGNFKKIFKVTETLKKNGIKVSFFIDPDKKQIEAAAEAGVDRIELHTGKYADADSVKKQSYYLEEIKSAAYFAKEKNLRVFAGHGLDYRNVRAVAAINEIEELNIGYSIICKSLITGLGPAVKEMKDLLL
ncbi:MAG: pyridoxine 5'-phosphate synthase [Candidatus Omnitrophica bacterium]|nr:pyridoxine 5'-phosphate synthase [Candidatus Omnitrophota bacterium]